MTEPLVNPAPQHFAFPAERQAQIEAATAARQAQSAPFQRKAPVTMPTMQHPQDRSGSTFPQQQPTFTGTPTAPTQVAPAAAYPSVVNPDQGFTAPVADPEGASLGLPSKFAYYAFKDLYVKPFKARHLAKLSRAHAEGSEHRC